MPRADFIAEITKGSNVANYADRLPAILAGTPRDMANAWGIQGRGNVMFGPTGIRIGNDTMTWEYAHKLLREIHGVGQAALFEETA